MNRVNVSGYRVQHKLVKVELLKTRLALFACVGGRREKLDSRYLRCGWRRHLCGWRKLTQSNVFGVGKEGKCAKNADLLAKKQKQYVNQHVVISSSAATKL
jgi:hypothetical protein